MSNLTVKIGPKNSPIPHKKIRDIVNKSYKLLQSGLTDKQEVEIMFVGQEEIKDLNKKYRDIDAPTDVLSFPQEQFKEVTINILGSVVICNEMVKQKNEEVDDVIKHGLLHLLGYDHEENEAEWETATKIVGCKL